MARPFLHVPQQAACFGDLPGTPTDFLPKPAIGGRDFGQALGEVPMKGVDIIPPSTPVSTIDAAMRALAEAQTPLELMKVANMAEALRVYASRAKLGLTVQNKAAEIRLRAERRIGELLTTTERQPVGRPKKNGSRENHLPRLVDLGVSKAMLHRALRLAAIPLKLFEDFLVQAHRIEWEITSRALIHACEHRQAATENQKRVTGGRIDDLVEFAHSGNRMGTLYIDPPWQIPGVVLPYFSI